MTPPQDPSPIGAGGGFDVAQDGNLFPREELLDAVAAADWRERSVPTWSLVLATLGLILLLLGLPTQAILVTAPGLVAANGPILAGIDLLTRSYPQLTGSIERDLFLVNGVIGGMHLPLLHMLGLVLGLGPRLAFVCAATGALGAGLVFTGTLPSWLPLVSMIAVLAFLVLVAADRAAREGDANTDRSTWTPWAVLCLIAPPVVALAPAMVARHRERRAPIGSAAIAGLALGALPWLIAHTPAPWSLTPTWIVALTPGALLPFGLWAWRAPRADEEVGPPPWMAAWGLAACAALALGGLVATPLVLAGAALLPLGVVLLGDQLQRIARADRAAVLAGVLLAVQVAGTATLRAAAPALEADDVATRHAEYLLEIRGADPAALEAHGGRL